MAKITISQDTILPLMVGGEKVGDLEVDIPEGFTEEEAAKILAVKTELEQCGSELRTVQNQVSEISDSVALLQSKTTRALGILEELVSVSGSSGSTVPPAGSTYYVSTGGADSSTGDQANPWRTISHAVSQVQAGDTILVEAGEYHEMVEILQKQDIALEGAVSSDGRTPVIISPDWVGVFLSGCERVTVEGFSVTGASLEGIHITGSEFVEIRNNTVYNNGSIGIHLTSLEGSTNYCLIENNMVSENGTEGIYVDVKGSNPVPMEGNKISGNDIINNGGDGIQNTNQNGVVPFPDYTEIVGNSLRGNGGWSSMDLSGNQLRIENNVVENTNSSAGCVYYSNGKGTLIMGNQLKNLSAEWNMADCIVVDNAQAEITFNELSGPVSRSGKGIVLLNGATAYMSDNNYTG